MPMLAAAKHFAGLPRFEANGLEETALIRVFIALAGASIGRSFRCKLTYMLRGR